MTLKPLRVLFFYLVIVVPVHAAALNSEMSGLREQALARYRAGRYGEAAGFYKKLAAMDPKNVAFLKDLMWALWQAGQYQEAAETARQIKELKPDDAEATTILTKTPQRVSQERFDTVRQKAVARYREGNYTEAVQLYETLADLEPENPHLLKDLMWALWRADRKEAAGEVASRVTTLRPDDTEAWNLLAESLSTRGQNDLAVRVYQNSLKVNPNQLKALIAAARLEFDMRNYSSALGFQEQIRKNHPDYREIYPQIARTQFASEKYAEAASHWERAIEEFPDKESYRYQYALSLYYNNERALALEKMLTLASHDQYTPAIHFLIDDALSGGDRVAAIKLVQQATQWLPEEENLPIKLAVLQLDVGDTAGCLKTLDELQKKNPKNHQGMILQADCLRKAGRFEDAIHIYEDILKLNPWAFQAHSGLSDAYVQLKQPAKAARVIARAIELDPTNPYLLIRQARLLYDAGQRDESRQILVNWLSKNDKTTVPTLLYHGLTARERDPMLAYSVHMRDSVFRDQMRAIRQAGYTPVTAEEVSAWYQNKGTLPENPILITFDDGRMDSFRYADPILQENKLKATMFACLVNVEADLPGYASWPLLEQYRASGRWEVESHGDASHGRILIDDHGNRGLFLTQRRWIPEQSRLETLEEFRERVVKDHTTAKSKFSARIGKSPSAFAFPEGEYGQNLISNFPEVASFNLETVKELFVTSYHQDLYGMNVRTRDPARLTRLEPGPDWSGEQLVRYLKDNAPMALVTRELFKQAAWKGDTHEAAKWLDQMEKSGASPEAQMLEEGRLRFYAGDVPRAQELSQQALAMNRNAETENFAKAVESRNGPVWVPTASYQEDNKDRENRIFDQSLTLPTRSKVDLIFTHRYADYREDTVPSVHEHAVGLGVKARLGMYHALYLQGAAHLLSGTAKNEVTGLGRLNSNWMDGWATTVEGGRALYDTARALNENILRSYVNMYSQWGHKDSWLLLAKGEHTDLSDHNKRNMGQASLSHDLIRPWALRGVYRFTYDHMRDQRPEYYSPQHLRQHQLGVELAPEFKALEVFASYMPGWGEESNSDRLFIEEFQGRLLFKLGSRTSFGPMASFGRTPTYRRDLYSLLFVHWF